MDDPTPDLAAPRVTRRNGCTWPTASRAERVLRGAVVVVLAACGASTSTTSERDVRPFHPSCEDACRGHCADGAEACASRCERECAPVPSDAQRVTRFVEAVQRSDARPFPPELEPEVAWRVYLSGMAAAALANVSPTEQPQIFAPIESELARSDSAEVRRGYVEFWREEIGDAPCMVTEDTLDESPFVIAPSIVPAVRVRVEPELSRAATWRSVLEVRCGDRAFRVVVLPDEPALVPLL